ncbi:hypothetical protein A3K48_00445 [candidate division WOR-1 bacterium RIFOXYA12_FULL_52_29]|uniref:EF-hand domain-containing protein n=1 Tax=candidate division WOR-1 bacterium RIFOXYC12_FULL_54_18 TaxID=1802584 RepID=A0A1F4T460_UNCSA|nr:MAG: hypothetical protein A3K44_00445 [candidate division WOR-1 bacterium RIFOXYA2_FULL_51_19]OGC17071.1 MAG: hypothetical protein A3K48_00445 [candidate division WOR-1 bacterium RIFOXYA12_FULL_52_29]OGC25932.1 MAG: hypothetical protein A3K32_00445 [candidate division WOR-1 bacterium RIFOXYB2_FULL_45_9]OGC27488.1 MAG: hypothetical protein A3K49_00445 [candidate division WOR-1 bacterium RIFOXYC12_FULL_54_18]OGC29299.1 MAG: hypothetical protein A2346_01260 [candidate division WOR-1 bacterium R
MDGIKNQADLNRLMRKYDKNNDGKITKEEVTETNRKSTTDTDQITDENFDQIAGKDGTADSISLSDVALTAEVHGYQQSANSLAALIDRGATIEDGNFIYRKEDGKYIVYNKTTGQETIYNSKTDLLAATRRNLTETHGADAPGNANAPYSVLSALGRIRNLIGKYVNLSQLVTTCGRDQNKIRREVNQSKIDQATAASALESATACDQALRAYEADSFNPAKKTATENAFKYWASLPHNANQTNEVANRSVTNMQTRFGHISTAANAITSAANLGQLANAVNQNRAIINSTSALRAQIETKGLVFLKTASTPENLSAAQSILPYMNKTVVGQSILNGEITNPEVARLVADHIDGAALATAIKSGKVTNPEVIATLAPRLNSGQAKEVIASRKVTNELTVRTLACQCNATDLYSLLTGTPPINSNVLNYVEANNRRQVGQRGVNLLTSASPNATAADLAAVRGPLRPFIQEYLPTNQRLLAFTYQGKNYAAVVVFQGGNWHLAKGTLPKDTIIKNDEGGAIDSRGQRHNVPQVCLIQTYEVDRGRSAHVRGESIDTGPIMVTRTRTIPITSLEHVAARGLVHPAGFLEPTVASRPNPPAAIVDTPANPIVPAPTIETPNAPLNHPAPIRQPGPSRPAPIRQTPTEQRQPAFDPNLPMSWLRRGIDTVRGAYARFTSFTATLPTRLTSVNELATNTAIHKPGASSTQGNTQLHTLNRPVIVTIEGKNLTIPANSVVTVTNGKVSQIAFFEPFTITAGGEEINCQRAGRVNLNADGTIASVLDQNTRDVLLAAYVQPSTPNTAVAQGPRTRPLVSPPVTRTAGGTVLAPAPVRIAANPVVQPQAPVTQVAPPPPPPPPLTIQPLAFRGTNIALPAGTTQGTDGTYTFHNAGTITVTLSSGTPGTRTIAVANGDTLTKDSKGNITILHNADKTRETCYATREPTMHNNNIKWVSYEKTNESGSTVAVVLASDQSMPSTGTARRRTTPPPPATAPVAASSLPPGLTFSSQVPGTSRGLIDSHTRPANGTHNVTAQGRILIYNSKNEVAVYNVLPGDKLTIESGKVVSLTRGTSTYTFAGNDALIDTSTPALLQPGQAATPTIVAQQPPQPVIPPPTVPPTVVTRQSTRPVRTTTPVTPRTLTTATASFAGTVTSTINFGNPGEQKTLQVTIDRGNNVTLPSGYQSSPAGYNRFITISHMAGSVHSVDFHITEPLTSATPNVPAGMMAVINSNNQLLGHINPQSGAFTRLASPVLNQGGLLVQGQRQEKTMTVRLGGVDYQATVTPTFTGALPDGLSSLKLASPATIAGISLPTGTVVEFGNNGRPTQARVDGPMTIGNVTVPAASSSEIRFTTASPQKIGSIKAGNYGLTCSINGQNVYVPPGLTAVLGSNGRITQLRVDERITSTDRFNPPASVSSAGGNPPRSILSGITLAPSGLIPGETFQVTPQGIAISYDTAARTSWNERIRTSDSSIKQLFRNSGVSGRLSLTFKPDGTMATDPPISNPPRLTPFLTPTREVTMQISIQQRRQ